MKQFLFRDLSVRWRLIGFMSILLMLVITAGTGGLLGMKTINDSLENVYIKSVIPLKELRELDNLLRLDIMRSVDGVLFDQISWEKCLIVTEKASSEIAVKSASLLNISDQGYDRKEEDWLLAFRPLSAASEQVLRELVTILKKEDIDRLDDFQDKKLAPFAFEYKEKINSLIHDRLGSIKSQWDRSQHRYSVSQMAFFLTILTGFTVCLLLGYLIMRSINKPLLFLAGSIEHVMQGDFSYRLEYDRRDEFGTLIVGFNKMSQYLSDLVRQIQKSGIQVTSSITELAATTKELEATANEHAATTSEIAASTTEIAATAMNLTNTMKQVNILTKNTAHAVEEGHSGLLNIDKTMVKMETATGDIVSKLSNLSEKAGNIAGVIKTINKVADQTNLLSLNAAIEAEKAGEYGAGFSVVATEIRRLADQTAVATYDIELMVNDVQSAVSSAVMGIDKFAEDVRISVRVIRDNSEQLGSVIEQVQVLIPQLKIINDGIEAQSLGAKQIKDATSQLNVAAQQTADTIVQTGRTIAQLQHAAQTLQQAISHFRVKDLSIHGGAHAFPSL